MSRFVQVDRQTDYLFPPSVEDWLPENHLARFIVDVVERVDLSDLTKQYAGRGSAAHHPAVLLGLLIYGYATGVPSSRKIERATYDSVAFRYIAANTHPDHDTLAAFRRRCGAQLGNLFVQVVGSFVTQACNDKQQVVPMLAILEEQHAQLGQAGTLLADTGYFSAANVAACEQAGVVPLIALRRDQYHLPVFERFTEPAPLADGASAVEAMAHRLKTRSGRADYALRKQTVEPVFGIIKHVMKFRQFLLRGVDKVGQEWNLVALAWNLKRMNTLHMG